MKLLITQLEDGENIFAYTSSRDGWVKDMKAQLEKRGNRIQGDLAIDLSLTKCEPDYYLRGKMRFQVEQTCSRCAEAFSLDVKHPFELALAHINTAKAKTKADVLSEESDELDVIHFQGKEIDLAPLAEEQFLLSLPYVAICRPDCAGICQKCGKNLNLGKCGCSQESTIHPFSVLKQVKL